MQEEPKKKKGKKCKKNILFITLMKINMITFSNIFMQQQQQIICTQSKKQTKKQKKI